MLQLKNINKVYTTGDITVQALKNVSLNFRSNEFVSILGPSGCGKTTLLNLIGGLDKYTDGDLVIRGRSTKDFKDRDWDTYRNHSIGFVFQGYNLIPHQTVLQNVELALTLSGVSKSERKAKAKKALEAVGLGDQLKKKPGEMSGGQMQRVAIARALVNNPDIILADEPTGALDSETSVTVMEILKEISKEKLVIMVTHNPELAEQYSTRIVKMLDGVIHSDSNEPSIDEYITQPEITDEKAVKKVKKPSMSLMTSFGLSLKNLITKKGRTILTSFAGSIGIIGIALIFAVSNGMTTFINTVQEDTLSSYPLVLETEHTDIGSLMEAFMNTSKSEYAHPNDGVYQKPALYKLIDAMNSIESHRNDLASFKTFLDQKRFGDNPDERLAQAISGVKYTYNYDLQVYVKNVDGSITVSDTEELIAEIMVKFMSNMANIQTDENDTGNMLSMMSQSNSSAGMWQELLAGENGDPINEMLKKQYDMVYGTWPNAYNEIVLIVDKNNELDDITLYALGLKTKEDIDNIVDAVLNKTDVEFKSESWSYEDICKMEFRTIMNSNRYIYDEESGLYIDMLKKDNPNADVSAGLKYLYDGGIPLKVTGIIKPNEDAASAMLQGSAIGYTHLLTEYMSENSGAIPALSAQLGNPQIDIFTGLPFKENTGNLTAEEKSNYFSNYVMGLSEKEKAEIYIKMMCLPSADYVNEVVGAQTANANRKVMEETLKPMYREVLKLEEPALSEYLASIPEEELLARYTTVLQAAVAQEYANGMEQSFRRYKVKQLAAMLDSEIDNYAVEQRAVFYDNVLEFSNSTLENNLKDLGYINLDNPSTINLYASTFENKDIIEEVIAEYNAGVDELGKITYTDYVGILMSSVTTIIDAIAYVLIAFVAVSLIVSSIMIGVITLISVQERTKEIGILRAIGASKKNISTMFNAETVIIGFAAGALGVIVTYLLCIPINAILHYLTGIGNLSAVLPIPVAVALICISVILTMLAGIIPSRSAAKKDPVIALRTE